MLHTEFDAVCAQPTVLPACSRINDASSRMFVRCLRDPTCPDDLQYEQNGTSQILLTDALSSSHYSTYILVVCHRDYPVLHPYCHHSPYIVWLLPRPSQPLSVSAASFS